MIESLRRFWWHLLLLAVLFGLYVTPAPPDLDALLSSTLGPKDDVRSVLVLTAHPDDEAMFFSPSILHLVKHGWNVRGLCMSVGNATGLGEIRRRELAESYRILGVPGEYVHYVDDLALQDSMAIKWDPQTILSHLQAHLDGYPASAILTFDDYGITNHPNHIALPVAAKLLVPPIPVIVLQSPSLATKFTGPLWKAVVRLRGASNPSSGVVSSSPGHWSTGVRAMLEHRSQLVWFRWLYLGFSRLMWVNELAVL